MRLLDGTGLGIHEIARLSRGVCPLGISPQAWDRITKSREVVEHQLGVGAAIYGTTTGIGSQKEVVVTPGDLANFSDRMVVSEATDFPGPLYPERTVRAALVVLINNLASGRSGVRPEIARRLLELCAGSRLPPIRQDTSLGVADLTPMSQLSLALLEATPEGEFGSGAGPRLAPKESLSLIDNNCFSLAAGALALVEVERLLASFDLAAATALEGFRGGMHPHRPSAAGAGIAHAGQTRSRTALLAALQGSALFDAGEARFLQDPLSFRSITQINGAARHVWAWTREIFEAEINGAIDNPLVDLETGELLPCSSMVSLLPVLSMDCLRQALAKVAQQSMERALKLQSKPFTGLPVGLAEDGAADGGVLSINLNYIGGARMGSLLAAAAPVLLHYVGHMADGVEDITTLTPLSISQTELVVERAWEAVALEMVIGVWAIARRQLDPARLGRGPRAVYDALLPLIQIGQEGRRVFQMAPIMDKVRRGDWLTFMEP